MLAKHEQSLRTELGVFGRYLRLPIVVENLDFHERCVEALRIALGKHEVQRLLLLPRGLDLCPNSLVTFDVDFCFLFGLDI